MHAVCSALSASEIEVIAARRTRQRQRPRPASGKCPSPLHVQTFESQNGRASAAQQRVFTRSASTAFADAEPIRGIHRWGVWYGSGTRRDRGGLMPDSDRRRPAVPSDELRRQLRERDEECYHLRSAIQRTHPGASVAILPRTPPLLVAAISAVAVLGISGGAALWNHCSSDAPLADR